MRQRGRSDASPSREKRGVYAVQLGGTSPARAPRRTRCSGAASPRIHFEAGPGRRAEG